MHKCGRNLKSAVLLKCYDALEDRGFVRFRKYGVDKPIKEGFKCWVGLNTVLLPEYFEIIPFVGVHAVRIAKLRAVLGQKYDRSVATYSLAMGRISGASDEQAFIFKRMDNDNFIASEVLRLADIYNTIGVNYAESISSYEVLLPLLESRVPMLGEYPERVACCLYLMGRKEEARSFVKSFRASEPSYFGAFASSFLRILA